MNRSSERSTSLIFWHPQSLALAVTVAGFFRAEFPVIFAKSIARFDGLVKSRHSGENRSPENL